MTPATPTSGTCPRSVGTRPSAPSIPPAAPSSPLLDTGVDASAPDLAGQLVDGTNILDGSDGTTDPNGHGTWMAGIMAAATDNGTDIAGVGYDGVKVMPVTVLDSTGTGLDSDIIAGVVWATDHGADVISMSFSSPGFSPALQAALDYAWENNVVLVAATGNDGSSITTYPAGDRGVIGVSNTDQSDSLDASSNYGPDAFLAAPGVGILTTAPGGGTISISGTSASAAEVAAAAALLRAVDPSASNGVIVSRLARNADPAGTVDQTGNGRLNLGRAITDTAGDYVQPTGSGYLGDGGPFVGPYTAATSTVTTVTLGTQSPNPVPRGGSAEFPVNITVSSPSSSNTTPIYVSFSISGALPTGVTASFSTSCFTASSETTYNNAATLTLTTTAGTPASGSFTVATTVRQTSCSSSPSAGDTVGGTLATFVPGSNGNNGSSGDLTLAAPAGTVAGDVLIASVTVQNAGSSSTPTGWTRSVPIRTARPFS